MTGQPRMQSLALAAEQRSRARDSGNPWPAAAARLLENMSQPGRIVEEPLFKFISRNFGVAGGRQVAAAPAALVNELEASPRLSHCGRWDLVLLGKRVSHSSAAAADGDGTGLVRPSNK